MTMIADEAPVNSLSSRGVARIVMLGSNAPGQVALMRIFTSSGAVVEEVADVPAMLARLACEPSPDLVVLEWNLSGMAGIEALQQVRGSGRDPPVPLPSSSGNAGMTSESGCTATGEIPPGGLGEIAQSWQARARERPGAVLRLDGCRAYWNGSRVDLSLTEFRIVCRLARLPGVDFSHRDIYDIMKGEGVVAGRGEEGYRGNVRAAIKRIRRKFVRIDPGFGAIQSYHGFGYRWDEGVMIEAAGKEGEAAAATAER